MNCNALYLDGSDLSNRQVTSYMAANFVTHMNHSCTCAHMLEVTLVAAFRH